MKESHTAATKTTITYVGIMLVHSQVLLNGDLTQMNPAASSVAEGLYTLGYFTIGMAVIGGVASYSLLRFSLVSPSVLVGLATVLSLADNVVTSGEAFTGVYMGWWYVFLVPVVVLAIVEYGLRRVSGVYPPEPLV